MVTGRSGSIFAAYDSGKNCEFRVALGADSPPLSLSYRLETPSAIGSLSSRLGGS
jgi:hypothetical protein